MIYILIAAAVFGLDYFIKRYIDKTYVLKDRHKRMNGKVYIEKFYNSGATLNLLAKHPKIMTALHSGMILCVGIFAYFSMRITGKTLAKTGLALLLGGGLNNLYDRYTKHHVVDYIRFGIGPKWFRRIIFNVSDFFIFLGALLTVAGNS